MTAPMGKKTGAPNFDQVLAQRGQALQKAIKMDGLEKKLQEEKEASNKRLQDIDAKDHTLVQKKNDVQAQREQNQAQKEAVQGQREQILAQKEKIQAQREKLLAEKARRAAIKSDA